MYDTGTIAFLAPVKEPNSPTRRRTDKLTKLIERVSKRLGFKCVFRLDTVNKTEISKTLGDMLKTATIVIADITDYNPNVLYECGLRHALKGHMIIIAQAGKIEKPIFDFYNKKFVYYEYNEELSQVIEESVFCDELEERIRNDLNDPASSKSFFDTLTPNEISVFFNKTVLTKYNKGKKDHYALAEKIANNKCRTLFLMQRSSSIILGAERNWQEEGVFLKHLMKTANTCEHFYHIVTVDGINDHIDREDSYFPEFELFQNRIRRSSNGAVELNIGNDKHFIIKKLPRATSAGDYKLDRQARVLIAEYEDGTISTVIVQNLGDDQLCFWAQGSSELGKYLHDCIDYYRSLEDLKMHEVLTLIEKYKKKLEV